MGLRIGLDNVEKRIFLTLPGLELRPLGRPARSQSLPTALSRLPYSKEHRITIIVRTCCAVSLTGREWWKGGWLDVGVFVSLLRFPSNPALCLQHWGTVHLLVHPAVRVSLH
jgi:hypothetical protein